MHNQCRHRLMEEGRDLCIPRLVVMLILMMTMACVIDNYALLLVCLTAGIPQFLRLTRAVHARLSKKVDSNNDFL